VLFFFPSSSYRQPFAMIGVKGAPPGSASCVMEKTKILLRLEATVFAQGKGEVGLKDFDTERTDINALFLSED